MAFSGVIISPPVTISSSLPPRIQSTKSQFKSETSINNLKSCKNLQEIKQLHCQCTKQGLLDDSTVLTNLVAKYSLIGSSESTEYAQKAFKILKNINEGDNRSTIYMYNSLIKGNTLAGFFSEAILLYGDMVSEGIKPDNYTFPFLLSACAKSLKLFEGLQIHGSILKLGFQNDMFVLNSLIYLYGECGEIDKGRKVFDEMSDRNVVSWTSLICGYARRDFHREAISLFFEMIEERIKPTEVTLVSVISACAKLGDFELGQRVSDVIDGCGLTINDVMINALVDMYMKCGAEEKVKKLFDECTDKNLILYNTLISNYVRLGKVKEALDVFREMLDAGQEPDRVTLLSVISSSAELGDLFFGTQCHAYVLRNWIESSDTINNSLINMYSKCGRQELGCRVFDQMSNKTIVSWNSLLAGFGFNGDVQAAQTLFNEMPEKNLVTWNTMIGSLVQRSFFTEAIKLFQTMHNAKITADKVTMVSIASACGYLGALDLAKWTYNYIEKNNIQCDLQLSTSLIDMFGRCGSPKNAMDIFRSMKEKDVSAWTAAIGAMAMCGTGERALELFHEMLGQKVKPDEVVFVGVLTACSHAGLVEEGMHIFNSMEKEYGIKPHIVHYGCIVDLLGRVGLLKESLDFIKNMPMEPNDKIWGAFVAACRKHKNEKLASYAAEMIDKSGNSKPGVHVLLSNIYASVGKWDNVAKVRIEMREKGMKKIPGFSSIEANGVIHEFTSGDENELSYSMLDEINCRIRDEGYIPDLTNVLVDVDEQEREFLLARHSEKLAIAFGLVSTSKGIPIRVTKNLRMCSDCHSFVKMVSKVYDREIVIRDNKRFHFFKQGLCSCCDFW